MINLCYVSSENMNYDFDKKKGRRKYEGLVKILGTEISKENVKLDAQK